MPSVRVRSIGPTSNIGAGGATPAPPTPITYLTQWKIVGNSEVHGQETWSCGEYSEVDGKYHILVQPQGGSIVDIALDEPLRKVNDIADTIELADGVATLTRIFGRTTLDSFGWDFYPSNTRWGCYTTDIKPAASTDSAANILCTIYNSVSSNQTLQSVTGIAMLVVERMFIFDPDYVLATDKTDFEAHIANVELIYEKTTPTTETIQVPQIQEAESYSCVISQGGKAVSWSSFETE